MHIPVRVRFVSAVMPHNVQVYVKDLRVLVVYFIDPDLIPARALPFLEWAVNAEAEHWAPIPEPEPTPGSSAQITLVDPQWSETRSTSAHQSPRGRNGHSAPR